MPPYQEIEDLLEYFYSPNTVWRDQWRLIQEMAWMVEDSSALLNNRADFGDAIQSGLRKAYVRNNVQVPSNRQLSALKENAIKDIESFRTTPEYWANIR